MQKGSTLVRSKSIGHIEDKSVADPENFFGSNRKMQTTKTMPGPVSLCSCLVHAEFPQFDARNSQLGKFDSAGKCFSGHTNGKFSLFLGVYGRWSLDTTLFLPPESENEVSMLRVRCEAVALPSSASLSVLGVFPRS